MTTDRLPPALRAQMERAFGADFTDVRVHESSPLADQHGARAIADGNDLHFAAGAFDPDSAAGRELIGHELAHVVQQRSGIPLAPQAYRPGGTADPLEHEADAQGARAARGEPAWIAMPARA